MKKLVAFILLLSFCIVGSSYAGKTIRNAPGGKRTSAQLTSTMGFPLDTGSADYWTDLAEHYAWVKAQTDVLYPTKPWYDGAAGQGTLIKFYGPTVANGGHGTYTALQGNDYVGTEGSGILWRLPIDAHPASGVTALINTDSNGNWGLTSVTGNSKYVGTNSSGVYGLYDISSGSMTWPASGGIPIYSGSSSWGTSLSSSTALHYLRRNAGNDGYEFGALPSNSDTAAGIVASGAAQVSKVWKTDAAGVPGWREDTVGEPGTTSDSFKTIATASGVDTDPVADSSTDTLNLVGTSPVTITGDSSTDTITVAMASNAYQAYDANMIAWPSTISATEVGYLNGLSEALSTTLGNKQASDADLTTYAGITPSANAQTLLTHTFAQMLSDIGAQAADATLGALAGLTITQGSIIQGTGTDAFSVLAKGTANQQLRMNSGATAVEWFTPGTGSGDVVGPLSATDNAVARFDSTTGKLIQNSSVTIDDSGNISATSYSSTAADAARRLELLNNTAAWSGCTSGIYGMSFDAGVLYICENGTKRGVISSLTGYASLGANTFTGNQALGANSITMTGSIAATGARVTKGWFTDVESTNMPTVGGVALSTTFAPLSNPTLTLAPTAGNGSGQVISLVAATGGIAAGNVCYINASGQLAKAQANAAGTMHAVCVAPSDITAAASGNCITSGVYKFSSTQSWTPGAKIYVSAATAGLLTSTAPSTSTNLVQAVGTALAADTILIQPSVDVGTVQ